MPKQEDFIIEHTLDFKIERTCWMEADDVAVAPEGQLFEELFTAIEELTRKMEAVNEDMER